VAVTHTVPPGRAAIARLRELIVEAKRRDPLAPVTVAVPSGYAGLSVRRALASGAVGPCDPAGTVGLANVRFLPLDRVAELLGAPALAQEGRRPLSGALETEALRGVLAKGPGAFGAVATHPATERALDRAFHELRDCTSAALAALAGASRRAADVVRLFTTWRQTLAGEWYDDVDLAASAAAAVAAGSPALADLGRVVVFLPHRLGPSHQALVDALGSRADIVVAEVRSPADACVDPPGSTTVVVVTDPDEEIRAVVRSISEHSAAGTPLHRMAVFHPPTGGYARLVAHQLAAAGLPYNGPANRTLAESVAGRALLGLLDLPSAGWRRGDVISWLSATPIVDGDPPRLVNATRWDGLSRRAGVVGGAEQWDERLARLAAELATEITDIDPEDDPDGRRERRQHDLEAIAALRTFVSELVARVEAVPVDLVRWRDLAAWAADLLDRYLGTDASWQRWPDADREAAVAVRAAVVSLGGLDALGLDADATVFRRALDRALAGLDRPVGRFGDGVFVAPIGLAPGIDVDVSFVVGLAEGVLPGRERDDPLLPDRERVMAGGGLADKPHRIDDERDALVAALASGRAARMVTVPQADLRQRRARIPSRWALDIAGRLVGADVYSDDLVGLASDTGPVRRVLSQQAGLAGATEPASLHDRDIRDLLAWVRRPAPIEDNALVRSIRPLARGIDAEQQRRANAFTAYDGRVPAGAVRLPAASDPLSPTSLEAYATCPRRYLFSRVLHVEAVEKPEEILRLSALDKGSLVHLVLERYVLGLLDGRPRSLDDLLRIADEVGAEFESRGVTGKSRWWQYDRQVLRRDLARFFESDHLEPVAAEMRFGIDDTTTAVVHDIGGRTLSFRGVADRVDRDGRGGLVVTDYKTGGNTAYKAITDDPVDRGRRLQLPIYGLAAQARYPDAPVHTRYWFVTATGGFDEIGYDLDGDAVARFTDVVATIADGIAAGAFPGRPGDADPRGGWDNCRWCAFDRVCPRDRARHWLAKRDAPELAGYVALAEGEP
jgi:RecB family exonuclease